MTLRNQGVPAAIVDDLGEAVDEALRLAGTSSQASAQTSTKTGAA